MTTLLGRPLDAIAGGAVGGILSIFGRGRRRRRDGQTRDAAMVRTLQMLNRIKSLFNQKSPGMDLDTAAANARNIKQQCFSAMGASGRETSTDCKGKARARHAFGSVNLGEY